MPIARRWVEDSTPLGRVWWVADRTISWLLSFQRLALPYGRTADTLPAVLTLACMLLSTAGRGSRRVSRGAPVRRR